MKKENFNRLVDYNGIRTLIVGTYTTPEGFAHGYFYSSACNKMYGLLSKLFQEDKENEHSFVYLKKKLICEVDSKIKEDVIKEINEKLKEHGLAFFDIVKAADRKEPYSSKDSDLKLEFIDWDTSTFESIERNIDKIVFTSKKAETWFKEIFHPRNSIKFHTIALRTFKDQDLLELSSFLKNEKF